MACIQDETLPASQAAESVISLCVKFANKDLQSSPSGETPTPHANSFLWEFWQLIFVEIVYDRPGLHARLVEIMHHMRKRGKSGFEGWKVYDEDMNWDNLPIFDELAKEEWRGTHLH